MVMGLYYSDQMLIDYIAGFINCEKDSVMYERIKEYVNDVPFGV